MHSRTSPPRRPPGRLPRLARRAIAAVAALFLAAGGLTPPAHAAEAADPSGLLLRYTFDETGGTVVHDASGHGNDGSYERTPAFGQGVEGGSFAMAGGPSSSTTAPYVKIPNGVLKGRSGVTVATYVKWNASTTVNQWLYGLGPDSTRYLFASPYNGGKILYSAITTGGWQAESKLSGGAALPGGAWKHVAVTVDGGSGTAVMYLDGIEVARATDVPVEPSDLYDATKDYTGYIGKSLYAADPYFAGEVDDFRIYDHALSATEVLQVSGNTAAVAGATLPELKVPAIVDGANGRIVLPVKEGTDLTRLAPAFTLVPGAGISPASGTVRDLSEPVTYTVTGSDGARRTWTAEARVMRSPVIPGLYADPNIAVFGDTFYMYPTTDGFAGWSGTQFHAFSSKDLVHWTDHGVVLDLGPDVTWADNSAWAPTIAERNGTYYFYFSGGMATGNTGKHLGVAVSDSPAGPFRDALGKPLVAAGTYGGQMIDSDVFVDDDGQAYLYWGNGGSYQVPLNDDMVSFDPAKVKTYKPSGYNEGSFVFKRGGIYYFMWSENDTRDENYQVAYATGASPLGPWTKRGVILQKDPSLGIKGTGHNSVVRVPGTDDWYIAYHRFAIPGGDGTHRETTVDRMEFDENGLIKKVVPTLESVAPVSVANAGPDVKGSEGAPIRLAGSAGGAAKWSYEPGEGVDSGATCSFADPGAAETAFTCSDDGAYTVTLTSGRSRDSARVTIANAVPEAGDVVTPAGPVEAGTRVTLSVPVADRGANDELTCTVDWKDGTTRPGAVAGGTCTARHTYAKPGVHEPAVAVADDDGATASATGRPVVVYDRDAGFVTGGGWIDSPPRAYRANPALTGMATFEFTARYAKNAAGKDHATPTGSTTFSFQSGPMEFTSTAYDWLVVSGGEVRYRGIGTIGGAGRYGFEVVARDGDTRDGDGVDRFAVRIWDERTGDVVYQNGAGDAVRGSVVVHAK
ncbi:family 43 glycosylhydrolase [Microbispora bryophytorum]|uniref:family 43 glycosylhydrolase n=1 Tax=Microbispora bryophytorum TaxID=1460882 RepID=UPI0033C28704